MFLHALTVDLCSFSIFNRNFRYQVDHTILLYNPQAIYYSKMYQFSIIFIENIMVGSSVKNNNSFLFNLNNKRKYVLLSPSTQHISDHLQVIIKILAQFFTVVSLISSVEQQSLLLLHLCSFRGGSQSFQGCSAVYNLYWKMCLSKCEHKGRTNQS